MAWVGRELKDHPVPTSLQWALPPDPAAQGPIQPGLECLQRWDIHNFTGQPVPVPHCPLSKKYLLNI